MASMNLQLKKFDPSKMADDAVSVFIAKRRSGKSVLMKDIMYHKRHALSAESFYQELRKAMGGIRIPKLGSFLTSSSIMTWIWKPSSA